MHILVKKNKNDSGMTLVEVLTAMLILGIIIIAIFPLITQSLQVTNLSHDISAQLFGEQEEIEIVAVTKDGAYLEDGTFIPTAYFPVVANGNITWVVGKTVKKDDLVRFLADNQVNSYDLFEVYEGYTSEEATFTIADKSLTADSQLEITDQSNTSFNESELSAVITPGEDITFTLPAASSRFTNLQSPYIITVTTGETEKTGLLLVHLPRAIIAKDTGGLLVASSPDPENWFAGGSSNWVTRSSSIEDANDINKIISVGLSESEARFIAIGKNGSIYSWKDGETVFAKLTSGVSADLNDIISTDYGLLVVGNSGVILQSSDGETWNTRTSGTTANLNAITYNNNKFVVVGNNGIMLTSPNGSTWTKLNSDPIMTISNKIGSKKAVEFSGLGEYLKTNSNPVTGTNYTVFMVVKPSVTPTDVSFLSLGPAGSSFTLRTNGTNLAAETKSESSTSSYTSSLAMDTNAAIIACRVEGPSIELYKNGTKQTGPITSVTPGSAVGMQLGSNPLNSFTNPLAFKGSIAEVLVFNDLLNNVRTERTWHLKYGLWGDKIVDTWYASEMDIVNKYLSKKYSISLLDSTIDNMYHSLGINFKLSNSILSWSTTPLNEYGNIDTDSNVWLDATDTDSVNITDGSQVREWNDVSGNSNHAGLPDLKAVAYSDSTHFYAGGDHRNLILYNGTTVIQDPDTLNGSTGKAIQYSIDDMIFAHERFIALLNDDLGSSNKYIATLDRPAGADYADVKVTSGNALNDIFHYTPSDTLLVVGNNGTIYYSVDGVNWTKKTLTGNLVAGCIR